MSGPDHHNFIRKMLRICSYAHDKIKFVNMHDMNEAHYIFGLNCLHFWYFVVIVTAPDRVACWCDVHLPSLHSASFCLGGLSVPVLWHSQPWGWCPLRGHQWGLALFTSIPISADMAMAQSPQTGHILRDTVICGHGYGPMQRWSVWQLEIKGWKNKTQSGRLPLFYNSCPVIGHSLLLLLSSLMWK